MIPEILKLPVIEFISRAGEIPHLKAAVMFGSAVKDEFHKKSDIDLLLLFDSKGNPEVGPEGKAAHKISSEVLSKHNIPHSFSFVMENINDPHLDTEFLRTIMNEGLVIWALPETKMAEGYERYLKPVTIFSYTLSHLAPKDKMAVHRALYGYSVEKTVKGKKYQNESEGLVGESGEKLGDGVIMVPSRLSKDVLSIFESHKVKYKKKEVWT